MPDPLVSGVRLTISLVLDLSLLTLAPLCSSSSTSSLTSPEALTPTTSTPSSSSLEVDRRYCLGLIWPILVECGVTPLLRGGRSCRHCCCRCHTRWRRCRKLCWTRSHCCQLTKTQASSPSAEHIICSLDHCFKGGCREVHMCDPLTDGCWELPMPKAINKFVAATTIKLVLTKIVKQGSCQL